MNTYRFEKEIPAEDGYDLVVAGGGPGGISAAVCAARLGAKVLLVEAAGCLGGMGTSGLVCAFDPMADGERMLTEGFMRELVETMYERGYMGPAVHPVGWQKVANIWTHFSAEGLKLVLDELAVSAGVEVRFFTKVVDAQMGQEPGTVDGVVLHNIEGYRYVRAKTFIDATGDAVLSLLAGAQVRIAGTDSPHIMPSSLPALFANVEWDEDMLFTQSPEVVELIEQEYEQGNLLQCDRHLVGMSPIGDTLGYLNGGHLFGLRSHNVRDVSDGMMLGRKIARDNERFLKKYAPNCEKIELAATASVMGVRESARILGEYELTFADYAQRRQFPDQIGVFNKFIDIHPYDCSREEYDRFVGEVFAAERLKTGECFGIPYGILVPKGFKNLWVAGRCNSSDVKVHGSIRVMPACVMMGQAAGTAAVQSVRSGQPACALDTRQLVETLREHGAYLPQEDLSETMTRTAVPSA